MNKRLSHAYRRIAICRAAMTCAAALVGATHTALGADLPVKAPDNTPDPFNWSGFYVGAHAGVEGARSAWSATRPGGAPNLSGSLDLFQAYDPFDGSGTHFAGVSAGYNYELPSRLVLGVEADVSFDAESASPYSAVQGFTSPAIGTATYSDTVELFGAVRGRVGYDVHHWLYYATGGLAWTYEQFNRTTINPGLTGAPPAGTSEGIFAGRVGWTIGAGVEARVAPGWSVKAEYLYAQFGA